MSYVDEVSGELVLRVVYDGLQGSGKTMNIRRVSESIHGQRRGRKKSPGEGGKGTNFFDWFDFRGGYVGGRAVRCQLIGVPGNPALRRRRNFLLEQADVIIFVIALKDETPRLSGELYRSLTICSLPGGSTHNTPVVVQLDGTGTLRKSDLLLLFDKLGPIDQQNVVQTEIQKGRGVLETLVLAMSLAANRSRLSIEWGGGPCMLGCSSPERLLSELLALDGESPPASMLQSQVYEVPSPRLNQIHISSVWPSKGASVILARVVKTSWEKGEQLVPWAPHRSTQYASTEGDLIHTSDTWLFPSIVEALRSHQKTIERYQTAQVDLPSGRMLCVAREGNKWRRWMISPSLESLDEKLRRLLFNCDCLGIVQALGEAKCATSSACAWKSGDGIFPGFKCIAVVQGEIFNLRVLDELSQKPQVVSPTDELKKLVVEAIGDDLTRLNCFREALAVVGKQTNEEI